MKESKIPFVDYLLKAPSEKYVQDFGFPHPDDVFRRFLRENHIDDANPGFPMSDVEYRRWYQDSKDILMSMIIDAPYSLALLKSNIQPISRHVI